MKAVALKLVLRSWWRNKTFSIISIVSLAIGIACTNLLAAFVIYEFNIEASNPDKDKIVYMAQDSPMKSGEIVSYIVGQIPIDLKEKYTEVEDYLRFSAINCKSVTIGDKRYEPILITTTDTTFAHFFKYKVLYGDLQDALSAPDKAALSESCARKLFGDANPIGKIVQIDLADGGMRYNDEVIAPSRSFQIAAVLKEYPQSYIRFDMLTGNEQEYHGGIALLKVSASFDKEGFAKKIKTDGVPTLQQEKGSYHFTSLQDSYFQHYTQESIPYIVRSQRSLLLIGLISALLILLIACFNYINLSFSRILQQIRIVHTQKLMGATRSEINSQLFLDTFLTVGIAFLLSLLIAHDLVPAFNRIMSGRITTGFFLNSQVLPFISGLILVLSVIPACYMSRKISNLTDSNYRIFFTGNKKRKIVTALSIIQYVISIGLIIGTLTIHAQLRLVQKKGESYRNLVEIGNWMGGNVNVSTIAAELKDKPGIASITRAGGSILYAWLRQIIIDNKDGSETYHSMVQYMGEESLLKTLDIQILQGVTPEEAIRKYDRPVYINQRYANILVPAGENPVGQPIQQYDKYFDDGTGQSCTICGIVSDIYINTLEEEVMPALIYLSDASAKNFQMLYVKLDEKRKKEGMEAIRTVWEKVNPSEYFTYVDVYAGFMQRNRKTTDMANLLLMYAIISIFLTCFGLFGMALYATEQRTKEIGIRKVNGASTGNIMLLLLRQFAGWIAIAFVIAVPVTWLLLNRWLEGFANRVSVAPIHFLLGGLTVLVITLLTVGWHSYRAASSNPVKSLRSE
ncbi:ABC transporter permease [Parabacteroides sp. AF17-28]|uniref:ABC transporter permease n=1 Tax=Parabacteroides sp. AF17-28 TaxID=2292241 RepID=UPI000F010629|nr:ABC transporter permease [Parabacteroides sp. AF17-28]RHR49985.1 ABC transporter permease [Parabacteroides sp. AF17-28]